MLRCQIADDRKVIGSGDERGLNEGRMYMLAATPGHKWVKARGGLARDIHRNDDLALGNIVVLRRTLGSGVGTTSHQRSGRGKHRSGQQRATGDGAMHKRLPSIGGASYAAPENNRRQ